MQEPYFSRGGNRITWVEQNTSNSEINTIIRIPRLSSCKGRNVIPGASQQYLQTISPACRDEVHKYHHELTLQRSEEEGEGIFLADREGNELDWNEIGWKRKFMKCSWLLIPLLLLPCSLDGLSPVSFEFHFISHLPSLPLPRRDRVILWNCN